MAQVTVRETKAEDVPQLRELMITYIVDFYQWRRPEDGKLDALIDMLLEKQRGVQFVAESGGKLVGFATLYFTFSTLRTGPITVMNDLYVEPAWRGQGAAQKLFQACKGYSARHGYERMTWQTASDNDRAQKFYENMGGELGGWLSYSINPTIGLGD
ncbi:GNAT family N-acetyltransferase [Paenibacillus athensensis]|uniref:GNAT family N-acetyltransferase n=1 Tax=Paenibacillus athensensis TaxID=1967502 RepID=A0A4Y8Q8J4_9BACL|nr:GNAT family N-acetyltransferase [Paenibacillus athensensis]MCD1260029.1 GNAT family N-acetyltransferase [Paenibacillus athensensis]